MLSVAKQRSRRFAGSFNWNEVAIANLRALWDEGLSTAQIGLRLGCSKNAAVGKAARIGLQPRPSPIKRVGPNGTATKLRPQQSLAVREVVKIQAVPMAAPTVVYSPFRTCQFIASNIRADYLFCGAQTKAGSAWCPLHHSICYGSSATREKAYLYWYEGKKIFHGVAVEIIQRKFSENYGLRKTVAQEIGVPPKSISQFLIHSFASLRDEKLDLLFGYFGMSRVEAAA